MNFDKTVLIIAFTNLKNDPRVYRQILSCSKEGYQVVAVGLKDPEIEGVTFVQVAKEETFFKKVFLAILLLVRSHQKYYWGLSPVKHAMSALRNRKADLIIANDTETLPLAVAMKLKMEGCKLLFDAHEYAPLEHEDSFMWRLLFKKEREHVLRTGKQHIDKMFTVCKGIAEKYHEVFGLEATVVTNASDYFEPNQVRTFNKEEKIKLIHHGVSLPARKIETMINMMDLLGDSFELNLMLVNANDNYHRELEKECDKRNNVKMIKPVPMKDIVSFISKFDVGLYILKPTNYNNMMALPNKIFEFIQARLIVAIGPSPEMARLVRENEIGIVAQDFSAEMMAKSIKLITEDKYRFYSDNVNVVAKEVNSQKNIDILNESVKELVWA
ncbi:MAG: hypothetical protein ACJA0Q_000610 [Saprospiraceae bacterium]|jgi:hypothetical protein